MNLLDIPGSWTPKQYGKSQILIHAGDDVAKFQYITDGYVKVNTITEEGEERILLILKKGDFFPLLKDPSKSRHLSLYFYAAMTDVKLQVIEQQEIIDKLRNNLEDSWELLRYISEFTVTLTERLAQQETRRAEEKLANLFAYLIPICGNPTKLNAYLLDLKLTHQDIAELIGVTRETVSVTMKKLEKDNTVMYRNGFLLLDNKYARSSLRT